MAGDHFDWFWNCRRKCEYKFRMLRKESYLSLRKSAAKMENSPNDSPLQYRMFDEYSLALRSMSFTARNESKNYK